jgi:hypothetical protein
VAEASRSRTYFWSRETYFWSREKKGFHGGGVAADTGASAPVPLLEHSWGSTARPRNAQATFRT